MTSLSDGNVRQSDVLRWAQEQAIFLSPPSTHHVLLYLCMNAFYTDENREGKQPGNVLTGRTRLRTIQRYTGLGRSTVKRALDILQDEGYVWCRMDGGSDPNEIYIAWNEDMDEMRTEYRAGLRALPKMFQREVPEAPEPRENPLAKVLPFTPKGGSN